MMRWISAAAVALAVAGPAAAAGDVVEDRPGRTSIDWTRGIVVATGAAAADLHARSPEVARVGAERRARQRARDALEGLARALPLAGGGSVGSAVGEDGAAAARLERSLGETIDVEVDYGADGSVVIRAGLPLEAVRIAVAGVPPAPAGADEPVTAVVVRTEGALEGPVLGLALRAADERYAGPTVYVREGGARGDPRLGDRVKTARATSREGGDLAVDLAPETLAAARDSGALVVVVLTGE